MTDLNLFEWATKNKVRFDIDRGKITVEELWVIPLESTSSVSLQSIAQGLYRKINEMEELNFVKKSTRSDTEVKRKFELVKYIIDARVEEKEKKEDQLKKKENDELIRSLIREKELDDLRNKSPEELRKMLNGS